MPARVLLWAFQVPSVSIDVFLDRKKALLSGGRDSDWDITLSKGVEYAGRDVDDGGA